MIHRDIKAENVFFSDPYTIKVGDFGFSTRIASDDELLSTYCGSPPYAAPELFRDESYRGPQVDYWALGVLLYFIVTATMPFKASTIFALKKLILDCRYDIPSFVSVECCQLIAGFLHHDPTKRYTLDQAKATRWLRNQVPCFAYPRYDLKSSLTRFQRDRRAKLAQIEGDNQHKLKLMHLPIPKHAPGDLLDIENTKDSEHILRKYQQQQTIISKEEIETFHNLTALGIDEDLLQRHLEKGSASHIVGMFRIFLHRERHQQQQQQQPGAAGSMASRRSKMSHVQRAQSLKTSPVLRRDDEVVNIETNIAHKTHSNVNNNLAPKLPRPTSKPLDRFWTAKKGGVDETTLKKFALSGNKEKSSKLNKRQFIETVTQGSDSDSCKRFSLKRLFSMNDSSASRESKSTPQDNSQAKVIHHHVVEIKTLISENVQQEQQTKLIQEPNITTTTNNNNVVTQRSSLNSTESSSSATSRPSSSQTNPNNISRKNAMQHPCNEVSAQQQHQLHKQHQQQQLYQFRQQQFQKKLKKEQEQIRQACNEVVQRTDQTADNSTIKSNKKSSTLCSNTSTKDHRAPTKIVHDVKVVPVIPNKVKHCSPFSTMFRGLGSNADDVSVRHALRRTQTTPNVAEAYQDHKVVDEDGLGKLPGSFSTGGSGSTTVSNNNHSHRHGKRLNRKHSQSVSTVTKHRTHCVIV